ncbi:MAG: heavy metal translocating P-type ATPase [candidate division KSB1 bacterium]|nr:heavy metal translocating P-type ATPase [candidate division KSB1 bacterium]
MSQDKILQFKINGMDCADCALKIEKQVGRLPGVKLAKVDFIQARLEVESLDAPVDVESIQKTVSELGYSVTEANPLQRTTLIVSGMDCPDESRPIEARLKKMPGVETIQFNLVANQLIVEHRCPISDIQRALEELGFRSELAERVSQKAKPSFWQRHKMLILTVISGVFAVLGGILRYLQIDNRIAIPILFIAVIAGGFHIFKKGWAEAKHLTLGMNFLMSIAVIGAMIIGEWSEAAMVIFLFALAQLLESYSLDRARKSIQSLMALAPNVALVKDESGAKLVPVDQVDIGQIIIIKPGERIPMDGRVVAGASFVNQSPITGESLPVAKSIDDEVFAGSINEKGTLEVSVTKKFADSTLSRIIHLVEQAQAKKAPTQSFVERFARYYTPAVVALAVLLAIVPPVVFHGTFTEWFYRALVLLVISCPCALVISTPVTIVSGLTNAARNGILIKGGAYLENFSRLKALAFDKTGTLTLGQPRVQAIIPINNFSEHEILTIAASLESRSEHPLAEAIVEYAQSKGIAFRPIEKFESLTGKGVRASIAGTTYLIGNHRLFEENGWCEAEIHEHLERLERKNFSAIILGKEEMVLGIIAIADALRPGTDQAIQALRQSGIHRTIMLTGDNFQTAEAIAQEVGIDEFLAELLPEDKVAAIKKLQSQYGEVAMVGDGINDAPALAMATMGISMGGSGTDTALETADIVLMKDDLGKLAYLKALSRKTGRIIKQNIFTALFLKAIFVALAIPGLATLWMAVFADMGASLMVVFNGLRALNSGAK